MKKYSLLLLSVALLAGCANSSSKQSSQKTLKPLGSLM